MSDKIRATATEADDEQMTLFGDLDQFKRSYQEWGGMPSYTNEDRSPWKSVLVHFENRADMERFAALVGQKLAETTRSIWYPEAEIGRLVNKRFVVPEEETE